MLFAPGLLSGQVAIVTGGGTGIGRGIALELGRCGASVVVAGRRPEPLEAVSCELRDMGGEAMGVSTDVRDYAAVTALAAAAMERFGRIDILVNNAGGQFGAAVADMSPNGWKSVIDVNLNGVFNCTRAVGDKMIPAGRGKVVNIIAGFTRRAAPRVSHSGAARAGVENLTRSLAIEWAPHNIQVNCISPVVLTDAMAQNMGERAAAFVEQVPARRYAAVEEVGWLVVFLCSRAGDYITGEHIALDGGYWLNVGLEGPR